MVCSCYPFNFVKQTQMCTLYIHLVAVKPSAGSGSVCKSCRLSILDEEIKDPSLMQNRKRSSWANSVAEPKSGRNGRMSWKVSGLTSQRLEWLKLDPYLNLNPFPNSNNSKRHPITNQPIPMNNMIKVLHNVNIAIITLER